MIKKNSDEKGGALFLVLWMLILLAVFSVAVSRQTIQELVAGKWIRDHVAGRFLAQAGIERGLAAVLADDVVTFDALNDPWATNEEAFKAIEIQGGSFTVFCGSYDVHKSIMEKEPAGSKMVSSSIGQEKPRYGVCDEAARININFADEKTLTELFLVTQPKINPMDAGKLAEAIIDWRDPDDAAMQQGAESSFYKLGRLPYAARNAPFESVEELRMIRGMKREIYEAVKDYVTVYTPKGKVNLNTASATVLRVLGLSESLAARMVELRKGEDGVEGTEDDVTFPVIEAIAPALSAAGTFSGEDFKQVTDMTGSQLADVKTETFRIQSIGRLIRNGLSLDTLVTCVATRSGAFLYWHEGDK